MQYLGFTECNTISYKVQINLHMFRALMLDWIGGQIHCTDIVTVYDSGSPGWTAEFQEKLPKPTRLGDTIGHRPILCLALDRETVAWRLEDQDTRLSPRKTQNLDIDRRVSGHPAQSASL
jgi:hypothetical protein